MSIIWLLVRNGIPGMETGEISMKKYRNILFCGAAVLALGCVPVSGFAATNPTTMTYEAFDVVSSGLQSGLTNPQVRVITQQEEYASLLSEISITGNMPIPDFRSNFMLAIFPGPIYGCKYDATVGSVLNTGKTLVVNVILHYPSPDTVCTAVMDFNSPYLFVELHHTITPISVLYHVVKW